MDIDYKAVGVRIRNIRRKRQLTQEEVAEACDISTSFCGHIERGTRKASVQTLLRICEILEISIDYVLRGITDPAKSSAVDSAKVLLLARLLTVLDTYFDEWFDG